MHNFKTLRACIFLIKISIYFLYYLSNISLLDMSSQKMEKICHCNDCNLFNISQIQRKLEFWLKKKKTKKQMC